MIVTNVRDEIRGDGVRELSGDLRFDVEPDVAHPLWLSRNDFGERTDSYANPLFANLLILAMAMNEPLRIEGPVSRELVDAAQSNLVPVLRRWHSRLSEVELDADWVSDAAPPSEVSSGAFFSGGVDSWYTLLQERNEVDALVHIHGFEIRPSDDVGWKRAHREVQDAADQTGLRVYPVMTNFMDGAMYNARRLLRTTSRQWLTIGNDAWYGSMLVAVGLSLRPALGRVIVPASWSEATTHAIASHPLMEPAWSTPQQRYEISGFDASRIDKITWLLREHPEVLERLRVCIKSSKRSGEALNCGRCVKCVRTMMEIRVCGGPENSLSVANPLDIQRAMRARYPGDREIWRSLAVAADRQGDVEIAHAVRVILGERFHLPRFCSNLKHVLRRRVVRRLRPSSIRVTR